ncbi:MAG: hypothetical protein KKH40_01630, partial [Nanoarchaeota archaeon]|nr:hypothetical protein [Nanoarchaeota archaeon]
FFDLINNVFIYEYSPKSFYVDELHSFLNDLKSFLDQLIIIHKDKKSFFSNLKEKFKIKKKGHSDEQEKQVKTEEQVVSKKEISSVVGYSNNLPSTEPSDDSYVKFQTFLEQLYFSFDNNDFETAKKYYNDLLSMYKSLDVDNQKKYYEELMDGYRKLSSNF